jgi:tRNA modification GTPase
METDSIVAQVTPPGEGGVGIVRASGPLASLLPGRLFPTLSSPWHSHRARVGHVTDPTTGSVLDEALALYMQAPRSYTGEDVFEIQCHGSPLVLERVVSLCLREGCRAARPGEFTLRAFLNGRLDLAQAEAVADVVRARSNAGLDQAVRHLSGWLSERVEPIRSSLVGCLAHMEAMVDFVEDDIPPQLDTEAIDSLHGALTAVERLLAGAAGGIVLREGATLAIAGSPNVGKSSIMNALLGMARSIVTPIAGTTRDTVEERLQIRGVPFRAIDTAGITHTNDVVEEIGVDRSRHAIDGANVVLLVLDRSRPLSQHDALAIDAVRSARTGTDGCTPRVVVALNKNDLADHLDLDGSVTDLAPVAIVEGNTVTPDGLDALRAALEIAAIGERRDEVVVTNVRHRDALARCVSALHRALNGLTAGTPLDLISFDVRAAAQSLGEITGIDVDDELLDRIFREFCIGK